MQEHERQQRAQAFGASPPKASTSSPYASGSVQDAEYRELKTQKMNQPESGSQYSQYAPSASAQGRSTPAPRSSSGYDIGSILGALGSLSGLFSSSGSSSSSSGSSPYTATTGTSHPTPVGPPQSSSGGSISKVLSNVMSNPATLEAFQRARSNPKVMAAVKDVIANPKSFVKYARDPDVMETLKELKGLF
eukprot:12719-Heterococcus_DN1.PRE.2